MRVKITDHINGEGLGSEAMGWGKGSFERRVNTFFTCQKIGFSCQICLNYLNSCPRVKWYRGVLRLFSLSLQRVMAGSRDYANH